MKKYIAVIALGAGLALGTESAAWAQTSRDGGGGGRADAPSGSANNNYQNHQTPPKAPQNSKGGTVNSVR